MTESVRVWRREGSAENDAHIFLEWLLDNPQERFWDLSIGTTERSSRSNAARSATLTTGIGSALRAGEAAPINHRRHHFPALQLPLYRRLPLLDPLNLQKSKYC